MKYLIVILFTCNAYAYDFTVNFDSLADGSKFQLAEQKSVFNDPSIVGQMNGDSGANILKIVTTGCKSGKCLQYFYPKDSYGTFVEIAGYGESGFVLYTAPADILNVEFDWQFKPGFDVNTGVGKMPGWLMIGGKNLNKGTQLLTIWHSKVNGKNIFAFVDQDPETGNTCCGSGSYGPPLETGRWYHIRQQMKVGADGFTKGWVDGVKVFEHGPFTVKTQELNAIVNFRSWFGGGIAQKAANDSYALLDNVHVWSGPCDSGTNIQVMSGKSK